MVRTCICITVFLLFLFIFRGTCATLQVLMCPKKNSTARQLKAQPAAGAPVAVIRQQPTPPQEAQPTTSPASATRPAVRHSRHPPPPVSPRKPPFLHRRLVSRPAELARRSISCRNAAATAQFLVGTLSVVHLHRYCALQRFQVRFPSLLGCKCYTMISLGIDFGASISASSCILDVHCIDPKSNSGHGSNQILDTYVSQIYLEFVIIIEKEKEKKKKQGKGSKQNKRK